MSAREAVEALNRIGARRMVTAERLARRGRLHPDAGVARLTVMWANVVLSADAKYPAEASFLPLFIRSALTEILTLGLWGDFRFQQALLERRSRKSARLILRAARQDRPEPGGSAT